MKKDDDMIIFESRQEIDEVIDILADWKSTHSINDEKSETAATLMKMLNIMYMEW